MNSFFREVTINATGAKDIKEIEVIQNLWSGYGKIVRYGLIEAERKSVIAKHVRLPEQEYHPRGWNTNLSHERKIKSYQVETAWYKQWSNHCDDDCRIPECLALVSHGDEVLMVMEDLDASGFPVRKSSVSDKDLRACLRWLANFHATFMGESPLNLWEKGTYWHLDTRPDELEALTDHSLKLAAEQIDRKLADSPYQTFVHGDAKLANFCFSKEGNKVAAVDFQYVGGGCGMKDVAYFIGSCLYEEECEKEEQRLLDYYFKELKQALHTKQKEIDANAVEKDWRTLYPVAWTDFHRFLKGWSPGHWKIHTYSERLAREVVQQLNANSRKAI